MGTCRFAWGITCGLLAVACAGSVAEVDDGVEVVMDPDVGCRGLSTELSSLEEDSPLGFSGRDVLDRVLGVHSSTLHWLPPSGPVYYEAGESMVDLEIQIEETTSRSWYVKAIDCDGAGTCPRTCVSRVEADTRVSLSTADDSIGGSWEHRLAAVGESMAFYELEATDLTGSLVIDDGWTLNSLEVHVEFNPEPGGRLMVEVTAPDGGPWFGVVGLWPPVL